MSTKQEGIDGGFELVCDLCGSQLDENFNCPKCGLDHSGPACSACGQSGCHKEGCPKTE